MKKNSSSAVLDNLHQLLRQAFEAGIKMSIDPQNANLPPLTLRTTTPHSPWFMTNCTICQNQFREGDLVRLCPRCEKPYHDDPQFNLTCWMQKFSAGGICTVANLDVRFSPQIIPACEYTWDGLLPDKADFMRSPAASLSSESVNQFVAGLRTSWPTFDDKQIYKVQSGDPMVSRICPWCRLRIRAGDWVVECPCGCGTYFHEDIFRHLTCWNEWNGVEGNEYCPNTGRPYKESRS